MSAIQGTGAFTGESDLVRRQGIQKGIQNQIMVAWTLHEVIAALGKADDGNFDPASGAPHNWDEGWAFYHGADPSCAPSAGAARVHQAEGWAFYRVLEPFVAKVDAVAAAPIATYYDLAAGAPRSGAGAAVQAALEPVYGGLGISADEIGTLQ